MLQIDADHHGSLTNVWHGFQLRASGLLCLFCMAVHLIHASPQALVAPKGWEQFKRFFMESNKEKPDKKFDFGIIGGPYYSNEVNWALGLALSGLYSTERSKPELPRSNLSLYGDISVTGHYSISIKGNHFFPSQKYRMNYNLSVVSTPGYFWGIGYLNGADMRNKSRYIWKERAVDVEFLVRMASRLYAGTEIHLGYMFGKELERYDLLNGQDIRNISAGVGLSLLYDTRDVVTSPYQGVLAELKQRFYPLLCNQYVFYRTEATANCYRRLWKGAVLATDLHLQLNYGNVSWTMMAQLGGSFRMRGYYLGRYRDRNIAEGHIELRQHIYNRHGMVAWVGAGSVFSDFNHLFLNRTLPNYGIGYRWEFKKRVNVRFDYGFGRGESGFVFQIGEAF